MKIKYSSFILTLAILFGLSASFGITLQKFEIADSLQFNITDNLASGFNYGISEQGVILFNDEVKYLTWLLFRSESYLGVLSLDGITNINLYGYFISFIYLIVGDWKPLFWIGIVFYLFFLRSLYLLADRIFNVRKASYIVSVFAIIPPVVDLSSGFMRDLLILAISMRVILYTVERRYFLILLSLLTLLVLRSFYLYLLFPLIYFAFSKNTNRTIFLSCTLWLVSLPILYIFKFGQGNFEEIVYRFVELILGISKILFFNFRYSLVSAEAFNFYSGLTFLAFSATTYLMIIIKKFLLPKGFVILLILSLTLSTFYGYTLGFFVPRTKLIFLIGIGFLITQMLITREKS